MNQTDVGDLLWKQSDSFPIEAVRYLAGANCNCQCNASQVDRNAHWPSCMVGRAQAYLGKPVAWERGKEVEG
jgi:hypothetical protein